MAKKATEYRWSRLELLPLEIRQRIYSYLGLPVARRFFQPCPMSLESFWRTYCNVPSHWAHIIAEEGWEKNHRSQYETCLWSTLTTITLKNPGDSLLQVPTAVTMENALQVQMESYSNHHVYGHFFFYNFEALKGARALLCVNKFIAADLYSLIVRKAEVVFNYQLSSERTSRGKSAWKPKKSVTGEPMRLSPFPFRFMTRVTLTSRIGSSARERYPHPPSVTKKWHRTDLAKQALSIRYIAQHCPNLICLTFVPSATKLTKTKMSGLDAITFSLLELVQKCEKLQTLRFQYLAWDPKPTAASVEALELWEVDEYGVQDGLKGVPVQRVLDVGGVPMWLREDEVAEWAMDVMLDIRHHKRDYGL